MGPVNDDERRDVGCKANRCFAAYPTQALVPKTPNAFGRARRFYEKSADLSDVERAFPQESSRVWGGDGVDDLLWRTIHERPIRLNVAR